MEILNNTKAKRRSQGIAFGIFRLLSLCIVLILFAILGFIIYKGIGVISWDFLTTAPTDGMTGGGIWPAIVGTFYLMVGSALFAFPVGVMSGIYMNEYAPKGKLVRFIRVMTNNLSGIPSIVFGLFGMALFVNYMDFGDSILAGSLTLGLLCVPLVIRTTEEALKAIPDSMREGSRALGATKLQTIWHVILPMGMPNIITGLILALGRVSGETAPILFTCAAYFLPAIAHKHLRSMYGIALSLVCDIDQRNGYGGAVASGLWNGLGTDCNHTPGEPAGQCLAKVF
jgi:phosphate transport system permease protein